MCCSLVRVELLNIVGGQSLDPEAFHVQFCDQYSDHGRKCGKNFDAYSAPEMTKAGNDSLTLEDDNEVFLTRLFVACGRSPWAKY